MVLPVYKFFYIPFFIGIYIGATKTTGFWRVWVDEQVSVDRWLFRCCIVWMALELSCLKILLSLKLERSREDILYDEIYIIIIEK